MATSPARPWFRFATEDPELREWGPVKLWVDEVEAIERRMFQRSNVYQSFHEGYGDIGLFGQSCGILIEGGDDPLHMIQLLHGRFWIARDAEGRATTLYRMLRWSVEKIVRRFGLDTISTSIRQPAEGRRHRFSWINEWQERTDRNGRPDGIEMIVPDWFYQAVLDDALVLTIDRTYFDLTGGLDRWLYRLVRKHGGRQREGWRFDFRHLHQKSGSMSPFKRFAFELRDIIRRQPLPGYRLFLEAEIGGRMLLAFEPTPACGKPVNGLVLSGTRTIVLSGTQGSCYREPKSGLTPEDHSQNRALNLESNKDSNLEERVRDVENLIRDTARSLSRAARNGASATPRASQPAPQPGGTEASEGSDTPRLPLDLPGGGQ